MASVFMFSVRIEQRLQERLEYAAQDAGCSVVGTFPSYFPAGVRPAIDAELRDREGIALVNFDDDAEAAAETVAALRSVGNPQIVCIAVGSRENPDAAIYALRSGCAEFIVSDSDSNAIVQQIARVANSLQPTVSIRGRNGTVILFAGARGGCGTTTIATHIALELGRDQDRKTLLVDHAPELGHAGLYLQEDPSQYSYADCIRSIDKLDGTMLSGYVRSLGSVDGVDGLDLLLSPDHSSPQGRESLLYREEKEQTSRILQLFRAEYDFVLIDTSFSHPEIASLLDLCDRAFIVAGPDIGCARDLRRRLGALNVSPVIEGKLRLIVNRDSAKLSVGSAAVSDAASIRTVGKVPNMYTEVCKAINLGFPIPYEVKPFYEALNAILSEIRTSTRKEGKPTPKSAKRFSFWGNK